LTDIKSFEFKPSDTLLSGIESVLDFYTTTDSKMEIVELTDGTICIGYDYWVSEYLPRNYYSFDDGREVFKRNTTRASDGAYSKIRVTGRDAEDNDLEPVTVDVENFRYWSLGSHRTKHLTAPDGLTQAGLQSWAEAQAKTLQYIGVAEDFVGPFRPQLVVGDIAEVIHSDTNTATSLGVITQVKQVFDKQSGFLTEFSVDSGGVATDADGSVIYSRSASVNGYNRRQSIVDLVRYTAEKAGQVDSLTPSDVGAEAKGTAAKLLSEHNTNEDAHQNIRDDVAKRLPMPSVAAKGQYLRVASVDADGKVKSTEAVSSSFSVPVFDLVVLGMNQIPSDGTGVTLTTNMTDIRSALDSGPVKLKFQLNNGSVIDMSAVCCPVYIPATDTYQAIFTTTYDADYNVRFTFSTDSVTASVTIGASVDTRAIANAAAELVRDDIAAGIDSAIGDSY
jgi:hypothetical protein